MRIQFDCWVENPAAAAAETIRPAVRNSAIHDDLAISNTQSPTLLMLNFPVNRYSALI
jgi:hypothetical protein